MVFEIFGGHESLCGWCIAPDMTREIIVNFFETATRRRFAVMDLLIRDHAARCASHAGRTPGDAELAAISSRATAACTAWEIAYLHWRSSRGTCKGRAHGVRELLSDLRGRHIALWQVMVQNTELAQRTWLKGTTAFRELFPLGRRPFQQGGIDARIAAVVTLAGDLAKIPSMGPVAALVRDFKTALENARRVQHMEKESVGMRSRGVEAQRRAAALVLYKNMARLMEKYAESPRVILTFFDLKDVKKFPGGKRPAVKPEAGNAREPAAEISRS